MSILSYITRYFLILTALGSFLAIPHASHAVSETTIGGQLSATIEPANPGPFEETTISLTSFGVDLRSSTITWSLNGRQLKRGIGETQQKVTMGATGVRTTVTVSVSGGGDSIQKTLVFVPQELSLTWEAQSYVPPLYQGKALPGPGAVVRLIALPEFKSESGATINPRDLTYRWQKGFEDIPEGTGKGKQTAEIKANVLGKTKVSVEVSSADGTLRAKKTVEIETAAPTLIFYKDRPLLGTDYAAPLGSNIFLTNAETTVRAEPYFFSLPFEQLLFSWLINGRPATPDTTNPQAITLRQEGGVTGSAELRTSVSAPGFLFQESRAVFTAVFGQ